MDHGERWWAVGHCLALLLLTVGATGAGQGTAAAQDTPDPTAMSLTDLMTLPVDHVYGASKYLQKVSDAPASITIVTGDEIKLYGYRNLADILRSVVGVSLSYDRNYTYFGMRGLSRPGDYNTRLLVLIDGHQMNDNVVQQAYLGNDFQVDVALIDRVEVIRGPAAALYGSSAFSAAINVVMKQGHRIDGFEASADVASLGTAQTRLTWGRRYAGGLEALLSASSYRSAGASSLFFPEFDHPDSHSGVASNLDAERTERLIATTSFKDLTVHALYSRRTKQVPTASFATVFDDGRERTADDRGFLDVQFAREIGRSWDVISRVYWDRFVYTGWYPTDYSDSGIPDIAVNRDDYLGVWWGGEFDLSRKIGRHHLTLGTEFRVNVHQDQRNADEGTDTVYLDDRRRSSSAAASLQDEWTMSRWLRLNVAARGERLAEGSTGFTPKIGLIVTPDHATTLKLLLSRALRSPTAYEMFYLSPSNDGNRGLDPEHIQSSEVTAERYFTPSMRVGASLFSNTYRDLIVDGTTNAGCIRLTNGLTARARGLDLTWAAKLRGGLETKASFSKLFDTDAASISWTSGAPKHLFKAGFGGAIAPLSMTAALELQYESSRLTYTGDVLPSATVVNLAFVRTGLGKNLELNASVLNVFGTRFSEPVSQNHIQGAILQDGRQALLGLTWRLK